MTLRTTTSTTADQLSRLVDEAAPRLLAISEGDASRKPAADKWSHKEILGHLIDSASNNHRRFVLAQLQDGLDFPGYEQDDWVRLQRYQDRPWRELVELWRALNLHLADVIRATPESERLRERRRHDLDRIAWKTVPSSEPTTLEYFHRDYVGHLRHHLEQVLR
jgi:hypothetical protein